MVSRKSEKMLCPKAQRNLCIGIVRANDVKYDEKRDEDIGGIGKLKAAICERKRQDKKHEQYVLQEPCLSIEWMNRGEHPENSAKCEQARNEFVLSAQNFPRRDQSQTLIEVKPCHARKLKISAESRQRGLSRICLPFVTALIAFRLARVRSISAVHSWAFFVETEREIKADQDMLRDVMRTLGVE